MYDYSLQGLLEREPRATFANGGKINVPDRSLSRISLLD
jgi:hypothetical protein